MKSDTSSTGETPTEAPAGIRLKNWRLDRKLTQAQLAEYLGVERLTIIRWETMNSNPSHEQILRLALNHYECLKQK